MTRVQIKFNIDFGLNFEFVKRYNEMGYKRKLKMKKKRKYDWVNDV